MGRTRYENQSAPSTPPTGTTDIYVDSADKHTKQIDDTGTIIDLTASANAITQLTGDVTAGPGTGSQVATIANDAVTLAKMANVATATVFYRKTAGTGDPEVQPLSTLKTDLGLTGTNSGDQTITLTSDVTGSGTGSFATTISANAVTNAKLAQMPANTIKGNNTGGTANALDLTQAQVTAMLNLFTTSLQGLTPASGGGTTNFLRADGTWAAPPSASAVSTYKYFFPAVDLDSPNSANWAINALAPASSDTANNALVVRRFDDTIEEGVGFQIFVPTGTTNIIFSWQARAQTAPGSSQTVICRLYNRQIPNNAAVTAWSAALQLTTLTVPTNTNFQYYSQTISLATLGITANRLCQFEFTRQGSNGSDTLVGDFNLVNFFVEFS
jgi:hypothetical protein